MSLRLPSHRGPVSRRRDQRGMTLVETVLAMALAVMMVVPIMGWARFAFGEQAATKDRTLAASGLAMLRTYVTRDLTGADAAWTTGVGLVDCTGGDGADGTPLLVVGDGSYRHVYSLATPSSGPAVLWRRTCQSPGGSAVQSLELVSAVQVGGTSVECVTGAGADGTCRRVNVRVTTPSLDQASITATVRSDGAASGTSDPLVSERAPVVSLTADPTSGGRGLVVRFSSDGTTDPTGSDLRYDWDFGDGTSSTQANPTKTYTTVGRFTAVLTVTNSAGVPSTDFVVIDVSNQAPEAVISAPDPDDSTVYRGQEVTFSAEGSNDDADADYGGRIVSYLWDFGDGTTSTEVEPVKSYSTLSPTQGFTVRLTVTDDLGATNQAQIKVVVANRTPTVTITATPPSGAPPLAVTLRADVTDETTMATNPPLTYSWQLGDGSTSTAASPTLTYTTTGTKTVQVTVTDDAGATATASTTVRVTRTPIAAFTLSPTSGRAPFNVSFTNTTSDPDNNARTWAWDFGDGGTSAVKSPPARSYTFNNAASDTFTGATYTVRLSVTDQYGTTTQATNTVTVTGAPAPTGLRASRSSTTATYRWNAVTPNINGYQLQVDFTGSCTDRLITVTTTSTSMNYGGTTTTTCARQTQYLNVRSRDSVTGKWGAWSATVKFN